jgi:hypothetical protein
MSKIISYQSNPVISFKNEGDEGAVLYNPDSDKVVIINAVGTAIWQFIDQPRTADEIVAMLAENFSDVDAVKAHEDLKQFIGGFEEGFIDEIS